MTLGQKQKHFARLIPFLLNKAFELGFEVTIGEVLRTPEQAALNARKGIGIKNSAHINKLAIDINLFKNNEYLTSSEDHRDLGEYWESLGSDELLTRWGGRFGDGNHYSIEHNGVK